MSPEIILVALGQGFHILEAITGARAKSECVSGVPGSKSVAGERTVCIGTWEKALKSRFGKYGLEIHPTKSRNISFGRYERQNAESQNRRPNTFDYLGFTHFCDLSRRGKFKIGRRTSRKKFVAKCKAMNEWLGKIRNKVETKEWWKILKAKARGHIQYYGISENYASIAKFYKITVRLAHKWLNRRSQKRKMNWEKFTQYLECYPLPKPKIVHNFYAGSNVL